MQLEVWTDIACPWCHIGKRNLDAALERFDGDVDVVWRSFELDPAAPPERDGDNAERLARKYATSVEEARIRLGQVAAVGAEAGLEFRFDRLRSGNTFDGHRLVHLAAARGLAAEMLEELLTAHMSDGLLVSDHGVLRRLAEDVGLDAGEVTGTLEGDRFADAVRSDEATAFELGIHAVPFFAVDRALAAQGAHPADVLLDLLRRGQVRASGLQHR